MNEPTYPSSSACLFSTAARIVTCKYCLSENTEPISNEHDTWYCNNCESFFTPPNGRTAALDRSGPRLTGRPD